MSTLEELLESVPPLERHAILDEFFKRQMDRHDSSYEVHKRLVRLATFNNDDHGTRVHTRGMQCAVDDSSTMMSLRNDLMMKTDCWHLGFKK